MFKILIAMLIATPALAAPEGGDWPCIQRRVPHLSLAQVWAGPLPDEATTALAKTPEVQAIAAHIALRRTPMPEVEAVIADYPGDLTALYVATFDHINLARDRVMSGITRYANKQTALDVAIKEKRADFERLSAADPPDYDAIDVAEAEIDWSTRIFLDRQQSLTYVCETPVILEQRAFAIGRAVAARID
ncbi:hypothetical protein QCN27_18760 [Cereibacter sp. SYSU M97828]|nr:hypothetical protein [Cereibacter flavus]